MSENFNFIRKEEDEYIQNHVLDIIQSDSVYGLQKYLQLVSSISCDVSKYEIHGTIMVSIIQNIMKYNAKRCQEFMCDCDVKIKFSDGISVIYALIYYNVLPCQEFISAIVRNNDICPNDVIAIASLIDSEQKEVHGNICTIMDMIYKHKSCNAYGDNVYNKKFSEHIGEGSYIKYTGIRNLKADGDANCHEVICDIVDYINAKERTVKPRNDSKSYEENEENGEYYTHKLVINYPA